MAKKKKLVVDLTTVRMDMLTLGELRILEEVAGTRAFDDDETGGPPPLARSVQLTVAAMVAAKRAGTPLSQAEAEDLVPGVDVEYVNPPQEDEEGNCSESAESNESQVE